MSVDGGVVARVRAAVTRHVDPAALLATYGDAEARTLLRERVRELAGQRLDDAAADGVCAELFGFGPLQPLLDDPAVTDVLVNAPDEVYVEREGRLMRSDVRFEDPAQLEELVFRVAAAVGRELTIERPYVDARLRDGSRANAVIAPVGGPTLSIRTFRRKTIPLAGGPPSWQVASELPGGIVTFLEEAVRTRANVLVSGATGSGKSTLVRALAAAIPHHERIVVIEDTSELVLPHPHVVHLECVPRHDTSVELADLVVNALRMRPDRILVGEVRSPREASALIEAIGTGHDGTLTTIHAGSADDALARVELLLARAGDLSEAALRQHARRAIDVIVHVTRSPNGPRRISEIARVGPEGSVPVWTL